MIKGPLGIQQESPEALFMYAGNYYTVISRLVYSNAGPSDAG